MTRKNKTISFNVADPHDLELFNHAERINPLTGKAQNFSKYVKRLIENDLKGSHPQYHIVEGTPQNEVNDELKSAMSSFL